MRWAALLLAFALIAPAHAFNLPSRPRTAIAVNGAATLNHDAGIVTTESLSTAAGSTYTLTLGCNQVTPNSVVSVSLSNGTNSTGDPTVSRVTPGNNVVTIVVTNRASAAALNGTLLIALIVFN